MERLAWHAKSRLFFFKELEEVHKHNNKLRDDKTQMKSVLYNRSFHKIDLCLQVTQMLQISKPKQYCFFLCQYVYDVNLDAGIVWLACVRDLKVARQFILIQCFPRLCLAQYGGKLYTIHHNHIVRCFRTHVLQTKTIINDVLGPFIYVWQWRTTCVPAARLNNAILRPIGRGGLSSYHLRIIRCRRYISSVFILFLGQYNEEIKQFSLFVTP